MEHEMSEKSLWGIVIALLVVFFAMMIMSTHATRTRFSEVCAEAGGVTVYDGAKFACIVIPKK
jgi:hypothetical protein